MASKTKDTIVSAFLELVEREEFSRITVTDLVEMCDISRQTFYYHFDDIDQMLRFAFENETRKICKGNSADGWAEYIQGYVPFFTRYDVLMRNALKSDSFILIYNLIKESFAYSLFEYFKTKKGENFAAAKPTEYLIELLSGAFTSLIVTETQKPESNFEEVFSRLSTALNGTGYNI